MVLHSNGSLPGALCLPRSLKQGAAPLVYILEDDIPSLDTTYTEVLMAAAVTVRWSAPQLGLGFVVAAAIAALGFMFLKGDAKVVHAAGLTDKAALAYQTTEKLVVTVNVPNENVKRAKGTLRIDLLGPKIGCRARTLQHSSDRQRQLQHRHHSEVERCLQSRPDAGSVSDYLNPVEQSGRDERPAYAVRPSGH